MRLAEGRRHHPPALGRAASTRPLSVPEGVRTLANTFQDPAAAHSPEVSRRDCTCRGRAHSLEHARRRGHVTQHAPNVFGCTRGRAADEAQAGQKYPQRATPSTSHSKDTTHLPLRSPGRIVFEPLAPDARRQVCFAPRLAIRSPMSWPCDQRPLLPIQALESRPPPSLVANSQAS